MSDVDLIVDAATKLFDEYLDEGAIRRARRGASLPEAWAAIEEAGLPLALVSTEHGGFDFAASDAMAIVRLAGAVTAPLPIGETMVANRVLSASGLSLATGMAALVPASGELFFDGDVVRGRVGRVPHGRDVETLVVEHEDGRVARLVAGWRVVEQGTNLAGHPRDLLEIDGVADFVVQNAPPLIACGAALRALQIAGAARRALDLTVDHVNYREQFGRPLARFQAVQHEAARAAGEVAAADAAGGIATEALDRRSDEAMRAIAVARVRAGDAAGVVASIAHQLHGAIGFAEEHRLHLLTTALWAWRDEFGPQSWWCRWLGDEVLRAGGAEFWPHVTAI